jgi:hypothetical protein
VIHTENNFSKQTIFSKDCFDFFLQNFWPGVNSAGVLYEKQLKDSQIFELFLADHFIFVWGNTWLFFFILEYT